MKVETTKGETYLVHNVPKTGLVATSTNNMSKQWTEKTSIPIEGDKNIQGMFKSTGLSAYLPQGEIKYVMQGTCLGSTDNMKDYLADKNKKWIEEEEWATTLRG